MDDRSGLADHRAVLVSAVVPAPVPVLVLMLRRFLGGMEVAHPRCCLCAALLSFCLRYFRRFHYTQTADSSAWEVGFWTDDAEHPLSADFDPDDYDDDDEMDTLEYEERLELENRETADDEIDDLNAVSLCAGASPVPHTRFRKAHAAVPSPGLAPG